MRAGAIYTLLLVMLGFHACVDSSDVGIGFIDEDPLSIKYYDTLSIKLSTVKFDSLVTSGSNRLLAGQVRNDPYGTIRSNAVFLVGNDSLNYYPDEDKAVYDSISFQMQFDGYFHSDTTQMQTFYLYSLLNELEPGDDGNLYNTSKVDFLRDSTNCLGNFSFSPRIRKGDPSYLKIDDEFGNALFDLLKEKNELLTVNEDFRDYMRGFILVPDSANTCMIGLNTSSGFILYYHEGNELYEQYFLINNNIQFSMIDADFSESALGQLSEQKQVLDSDLLDNIALIHGGIGLAIRFEIPYLDYVRELSKNTLVTDAELILKPVKNSYSDLEPLTTEIGAYVVDKHNRINSNFPINPVLYFDDEFQEDTYYSIDIHQYLENQLELIENDGSAILFTLSKSINSNTINRIAIGDKDHQNQSYLKLIVMNINDSF
jgi:hypothetical protein